CHCCFSPQRLHLVGAARAEAGAVPPGPGARAERRRAPAGLRLEPASQVQAAESQWWSGGHSYEKRPCACLLPPTSREGPDHEAVVCSWSQSHRMEAFGAGAWEWAETGPWS
ncbi:PREDICTED: uncharacterized protein LOC103768762, partial [Merops nubicus]|uniref:uncharacterized protein LOC103768762 n=1 Tax=Merops nubicus TaxID=57421 RepID=UPI0004F024CC